MRRCAAADGDGDACACPLFSRVCVVEVTCEEEFLGLRLQPSRAPWAPAVVKSFWQGADGAAGQLERSGRVAVGDVLCAVNGHSVLRMSYGETTRGLASAARPLTLQFLHETGEANDDDEDDDPDNDDRQRAAAFARHALQQAPRRAEVCALQTLVKTSSCQLETGAGHSEQVMRSVHAGVQELQTQLEPGWREFMGARGTPSALLEAQDAQLYAVMLRLVVDPVSFFLFDCARRETAAADARFRGARSSRAACTQTQALLPAERQSPSGWAEAVWQLDSVDSALTFSGKVRALLRCMAAIDADFKAREQTAGGDDLLGVFIFALSASALKWPHATVAFLRTMCPPALTSDRVGYVITTLAAALHFVDEQNVEGARRSLGVIAGRIAIGGTSGGGQQGAGVGVGVGDGQQEDDDGVATGAQLEAWMLTNVPEIAGGPEAARELIAVMAAQGALSGVPRFEGEMLYRYRPSAGGVG